MIVRLRCSMHKEIYVSDLLVDVISWLLVLNLMWCYSILTIVLLLDLFGFAVLHMLNYETIRHSCV